MNTKSVALRECCFKTLPEEGRKLVWEITHRCNFGCPYCFQAKKRLENRMRILHPTDMHAIIEKLHVLLISDVLLTGGEIYWVRDSLPEICKHLTEKAISYSLSTTFIHDAEFIDFLLNLKPRALNISFDPCMGETKEKRDRFIERIRYVLTRCQQEKISVKATGVLTKISILNMNEYIAELESLISEYECLSSIYITNPYDIGYVKADVRPSEDALRKAIKILEVPSTTREKVRLINFHRFNAPLQNCPAGVKIVHLEPNGDVYPCHLFANLPRETFFLGNLILDSVEEIDARLNDFARRTREAIEDYKDIDECRKCRVARKCGGGCIAEIVSVGKLIEPQLICKKIRAPQKRVLFEPSESLLQLTSLHGGDLSSEERQKIIEHVSQNLRKGHDLAHGFDHINCVVEYARHIAKTEGANLRIVTAAAYFHDYEPRRKLIYEQHTEYSAQQAVVFLGGLGFTPSEVNQIYECIISSSYGAHEVGRKPLSLEAKCVRDADWLDAIGARGIARVFAFGAAHGCEELGDVEWPLDPPTKKRMSRIGPDPSPIYHFFSKLLWVKDKMLTTTGKRLSEIRHIRMLNFLKQYRAEMHMGDIGQEDALDTK